MVDKWIKELEKEIEKINNWKTKDRLSMVALLTFMNASIASSVTGWNSWLTNATVMEKFTERELNSLVEDFKKIAIAFIELDLKYTKKLKKKGKKKEERQGYTV